jgi:hypothetical protein
MRLTSVVIAMLMTGTVSAAGAQSQARLPAQAAPFGLREGMSKSDLDAVAGPLSVQDGTPPTFYAAHVPKPHPDLGVYAVVVGDSTGLCQVVGGKLIDSTGVTDIEADRVFNELKGQLTAKYGKPSAVEKSQARWLKISDAAMPKNLDAITLSTARQSSGANLVSIRYRFANANRCAAPALAADPVRDAL